MQKPSEAESGPSQRGHRPQLIHLSARREPQAVVLVLHGGSPLSALPVAPTDPAFLRMLPFAQALRRRSRGAVGVALLRHAVRGWNGDERSPVHDAEWAMGRLAERWPGRPIGLLGHSMGGRTALTLAAESSPAAVAALAPWVTGAEPVDQIARIPLLVMHGRADHATSPDLSRNLVDRVRAAGGEARYIGMSGGHAMLRNAARWHREPADALIRRLIGPGR